jgi:hypothetical protein
LAPTFASRDEDTASHVDIVIVLELARAGQPSRGTIIRVLLIWMLMSSTLGSTQSLSAPVLKAAFLYNFTKFTEWPADALLPKAPLEFCIIAARMLLMRSIPGHRLMLADHPLADSRE